VRGSPRGEGKGRGEDNVDMGEETRARRFAGESRDPEPYETGYGMLPQGCKSRDPLPVPIRELIRRTAAVSLSGNGNS
jgi:hypothetical protein